MTSKPKNKAAPYVSDEIVEALEQRFLSRIPSTEDSYNRFIAFSAHNDVINQLKAWQQQNEKEGMPDVYVS